MNETKLTARATPDVARAGLALDGTRLRVGVDILAHHGFHCRGELRLHNAEVAGSLRWEGATVENRDGRALFAPDLRVGAIANLCEGFVVDGSVSLHYAHITSRLCFDRATLRGSEQAKLGLRHLETRDLVLTPTEPPPR